MECYVIPDNEVLAFGCCSCSYLESYTWDLEHCFAARGPSGRGLPDHPRLMPTDFTTFPHFSISSAMSLPKLTGEPRRAVAPSSASRVLILGSARPAFDLFVERFDDIGSCALWSPEAGNSACLVARQEFPNGRHVRQRLRARDGRHSQRAQIARPNVCDG